MADPTLAIRLFGTEEPVPPMRPLKAGPLTALLDAGNLRYIRVAGVEAIRAISFIVRDVNWGTAAPDIEGLHVEEEGGGFVVTYHATCRADGHVLRYSARIEGRPNGTLGFAAKAVPEDDFPTNRTGFVVLHPLDGVAGAPLEVLKTDGTIEKTAFPAEISPHQPVFDIRALRHEVFPGVRVTCSMEGDAFEMEDQRNWTDASYKTYVRPLSEPYPYVLPAGQPVEQSVTLTIEGAVPAAAEAAGPILVAVGAEAGTVPRIGLGLEPERTAMALEASPQARRARPQLLVGFFDTASHGIDDLAAYERARRAIGGEFILQAVIPGRDAVAEAVALAAAVGGAGLHLDGLTLAPARDRRTRPTGVPEGEAPLEAIVAAGREAFPGVPLGGGTPAYFTELNRNRPPAEALDWISHGTAAIVHGADDVTVAETLEALPWILRSARAFSGDRPIRLGPSAIGMRWNPYGAATIPNPGNGRVPMARMDPRQRGLFGAAWALGYVAHAAREGVEAVILGAPAGEFGIVHQPADWPTPGFDRAGQLYPVWHVVAGLAGAARAPLLATGIDAPGRVQALACEQDGRGVLWLANLTGEPQEVGFDNFEPRRISRLDQETFAACRLRPEGFAAEDLAGPVVTLGPYAVVRIEE